jgi:hypothetical protein
MVVGTKTYGCGNKDLGLWEQIYGYFNKKYMVLGTKTYDCWNKDICFVGKKQIYGVGTKPRIVGTITYGCGNKTMMWEQNLGL